MLIKLTTPGSKISFYIEHSLCLVVQRNPSNPLITQLMTSLQTPKGMAVYEVMETPEFIADSINLAYQGQVPPSAMLQH